MARRIAIVGAGQSGLQLALGLLGAGHDVTLVSEKTGAEFATGPVYSSQCMFSSALASERALGLDFWRRECPPVDRVAFTSAGGIAWSAPLDAPAQSVDQRVKLSAWMQEFEQHGGRLIVQEAGIGDLERHAREHELTVVATGRGALGELFARDAERSAYGAPQRALGLTYVRERAADSALRFNFAPGVGEYLVFPALTLDGPCEIMVFEGVPGGPMDCWGDVCTPDEHLARSLAILERFFPWEYARCHSVELTDPQGVLRGGFTPTVRHPVARLPSGAAVLAMADAAVLNDPLTAQGSNNAAKCAEIYLERILGHEHGSFDPEWMHQTFDHYWQGYGRWAVAWTNAVLAPPKPHVCRLFEAAQTMPALAATIANAFDDPRAVDPWWFDEREAGRLIAEKRAEQERGLDLRDLRQALGQFATGVTVVTARGADGQRVGVTANSFTSLSLEPPLVLWCLARDSTSLPTFRVAEHFTVNVLAAHQHHLSRLFATSGADKFEGVQTREGVHGIPVLEGALANYACRSVRQIEAGDHVIFIGEVEGYELFDGEPLVFHSGTYRITTRHPDFDQP
jgi:flavin reductase (DIM6/NTAB) family NADH-FMN oxidoreductase RutF/2-polyprenyl-6-methoxyphenol hydroxylase-like FAD-dependent oxidoreductase